MNLQSLKWPKDEAESYARGGRYHKASAICERGHQIDRSLSPRSTMHVPDRCTDCGALILISCEKCTVRIPGTLYGGDIMFEMSPNELPFFCDNCGFMYPWATKKQKIYELENRLRLEEIDEADYEAIKVQLEKLLNPDISQEEEKNAWEKIKSKAGATLKSENVREIVLSLINKVVRDQLGI